MSFPSLLRRSVTRLTRRDTQDHERAADAQNVPQPYQVNTSKLSDRLVDVFKRTFDLGVTAFGGPPVHFQIFHRRFVDGVGGKTPWIDEQTVSDLHVKIAESRA